MSKKLIRADSKGGFTLQGMSANRCSTKVTCKFRKTYTRKEGALKVKQAPQKVLLKYGLHKGPLT